MNLGIDTRRGDSQVRTPSHMQQTPYGWSVACCHEPWHFGVISQSMLLHDKPALPKNSSPTSKMQPALLAVGSRACMSRG